MFDLSFVHAHRLKHDFTINTKCCTDAGQKRITARSCPTQTVLRFVAWTSALPGSHQDEHSMRGGSLREKHTSADNVLCQLEGMFPFGRCTRQITYIGKLGF